MTTEEELLFWKHYSEYIGSGTQRKGQALMNALRLFPELYDMATMSNTDPFYQDSNIPAFCRMLGIAEP